VGSEDLALEFGPLTVPLHADPRGVVRVGGTRVTLDTLVGTYEQGRSAEQIAESFPTLDLADIHAVLSFYLRNREDVEAYLREQERQAADVRRRYEAEFGTQDGLRERLLERLAQRERAGA
jgi:uncharacterized protein (DUF433 family)